MRNEAFQIFDAFRRKEMRYWLHFVIRLSVRRYHKKTLTTVGRIKTFFDKSLKLVPNWLLN